MKAHTKDGKEIHGLKIKLEPMEGKPETNYGVFYAISHATENGADEIAKEELVRVFGQEQYDAEIGALKDSTEGYIAMLNERPTPIRVTWVALVHAAVNGKRATITGSFDSEDDAVAHQMAEALATAARKLTPQPATDPMEIN